MGKYFGTDGIRGVAFEKLNAELAFKVGIAIGKVIKPKTIVLGTDTRKSKDMLAYSLAAGVMSQGVDVLFAGVVSTPMIAYYSELHQTIGVMITASHNPYMDNGIKVFNKGYKTVDSLELELEHVIDHGPFTPTDVFGKLELTDKVEKAYMDFYDNLGLKPSSLKIVYDSANGANYEISNKIFNKYYKNAVQYNNQPDGYNINVGCGSTHMEYITNKVIIDKADIGFAYDGDADRCLVSDRFGRVVDGDLLMYIFATYMKEQGLLNKNHLVVTKMSNPGMLKELKKQGIKFSLTDVGDKYVFKEMNDNGYSLGGEASGHIILNHLMHSGDGLLVSLYLLKILEEKQVNLEDLVKHIELYPFTLVNLKNIDKKVLEKEVVKSLIKEVKDTLGEDSLVLIRPSGTEPLVRVTISHQDQALIDASVDKIVNLIKKEGSLSWKSTH